MNYDQIIDDLAGALGRLSGPVYVSWGHEMDQDLNERYPWSGQKPEQFVKAYRYVVDQFRRQVKTELRWVWAGVQKSGSPDFESSWLHQTFMHLGEYPDLAAIVFFYSRDTEGAWSKNMPTPDWRVHPESIRGLVDWSLRQVTPN